MRLRRAVAGIVLLLLTCAIAACGGSSSNDVASKSATGIVTAAMSAVSGAHSAHVSGSNVTAGVPTSLNLDLVSGQGGRGQMSKGGQRFQIVVIGGEVYINGSSAFWRRLGGSVVAKRLHGKWVKAPASGQFASFAQLSDMHALLGTLLATHGALVKRGTTSVDGQSVVGVRDTTKNATLYVATTGTPYPIEIVTRGSNHGQIKLSRFNESVSLTPPAGAVDLSALG